VETLYVQFSDSTQTAIITYFAGPQDPNVYPNLGTVTTGDARWKQFYDSLSDEMKFGLPQPSQ